jgi:GNAT superfamily N-acetyltransferase
MTRQFARLDALKGPEVDSFIIRFMKPREERQVAALAIGVFEKDVAPHYSPDGAREFLVYADPSALAQRAAAGHFVLVGEINGEIAAMIEMREFHHVSMFFVAGEHQRKGVGRAVLREALVLCRRRRPDLQTVSVHASPNARDAYERFGFKPAAGEENVNGIRFTRMTLEFAEADAYG